MTDPSSMSVEQLKHLLSWVDAKASYHRHAKADAKVSELAMAHEGELDRYEKIAAMLRAAVEQANRKDEHDGR